MGKNGTQELGWAPWKDSDDSKNLLTQTPQSLCYSKRSLLPSMTEDDPALLKDPVVIPFEVLSWQVSTNSPHALLHSPSLPSYL